MPNSVTANCAWHKLFNFPDTFRTRRSTVDRIHTLVQVLKFPLPSENTAQLLQNLSEIENSTKRHIYLSLCVIDTDTKLHTTHMRIGSNLQSSPQSLWMAVSSAGLGKGRLDTKID